MPIYNKLVRDRIPEIIEGTGKASSTSFKDKIFLIEVEDE